MELTKLKYSTGVVSSIGKNSNNFDNAETASSSDEEKSNGSEFGECVSTRDLKNKLPQVEKEIAEMLKLKVI
jgi:hypothetical protein